MFIARIKFRKNYRLKYAVCTLILLCSYTYGDNESFKLQKGDLLFQDLNCGEFCDSIDSVTYGYDNTYVSHVAMVIDSSESSAKVIEAVSNGVTITQLDTFLKRSLDENKKPRVMVGRVSRQYQKLIPTAIFYAEKQLSKPYNDSFIPANGKAFYCSELIANAFESDNQSIFQSNPMNFADTKNNILPIWQKYYIVNL